MNRNILAILAILSLSFSGMSVEAKGVNNFVKKKISKTATVPAPFSKGDYLFTCSSWGDCGNYNIAK